MKRGAKRNRETYADKQRAKSAVGAGAYSKLWGIVDGGVADALKMHPDYLTPKGLRSARTSIVKRVTGTVISFAEQSARGRGNPAETADRALHPEMPASDDTTPDAGAGAYSVSPTIGMIRFKRRTRYRSPDIFNLRTHELRMAVASLGVTVKLSEKGMG